MEKGDWVVMAAWLVQLRSQQQAAAEADQFRVRLIALQTMQALASWLERRPQLGRDVFACGHPPSRAQSREVFGVSVETGQAVDVIEFLWASLALFDDPEPPETRALTYAANVAAGKSYTFVIGNAASWLNGTGPQKWTYDGEPDLEAKNDTLCCSVTFTNKAWAG